MVLSSCGDAWWLACWLGERLEGPSTSRLAWRLLAGVEAVAMFASLISRGKMGSRRFARAALSTWLGLR